MSSKFIDAHEAARWVASGDTVCTVGMTLIGAAESILSAIEARFLTAGEPRDLTLLHAAGQSDRQRGIQRFAHPGMVTRLIGSHWGLAPRWMAMINNNEVEAWCLPQGQIVHLYSAMAAGLPGRLSPVGLGTFVDPRIEGGRMNARTRERPNLIEHVTFRGDEYLFYPALPLDVVIVRGTHADEDGNLTTDEEVMKLEVLHAVLAARRYGAKVLAQVKYRVAKGLAASEKHHRSRQPDRRHCGVRRAADGSPPDFKLGLRPSAVRRYPAARRAECAAAAGPAQAYRADCLPLSDPRLRHQSRHRYSQ